MKLSQKISTLNASSFRDVFLLKSVNLFDDGEGGWTTNKVDIKTIFGKIEPKSESRALDADQLEYTMAYQIYCRYDPWVDNKKILNYKGRDLTIHSVINIGELNQFFSILAYYNG